MSSSMTLEERVEALMKNFEYLQAQNEEKEAQNNYLQRQLNVFMKEKRRDLKSSSSSRRHSSAHGGEDKEGPLSGGSRSEEDSPRHPREGRRQANHSSDFKVDIPEFEGKLDPDDFLEWMQTVERIFEYKEVPEDKKVKLVALKLGKYASLWWTNLRAKRARQGKDKIRTWEKMRAKLKARFLPPTYLHKNYSQLHPLPTKAEPPKRELTKPLPKEQPSNKGSPSYPPKPATPPTSFPQEDHAPQNSHPPQNEPSPNLITPKSCFKCQDLDHITLECWSGNITSLAECEDNLEEEENLEVCMMEEQDEDVENVEEGGWIDLRKSLPKTEEPLKDGGVLSFFFQPNPKAEPNESIIFNDSNFKSYFVDGKLENLRTNSFLEGENDAYLHSPKQVAKRPKASKQVQAHKHKKRLAFQPGDLVWVNVRKERFSFKRSTKLMPRDEGPFEILGRANDHSYKVHLSGGFGVSATFNMDDLSPYVEDDQESNLRANSSQQGENDGDGPMVHCHESQGIPRGPRKRPKVKEKERNVNNQLSILPGQTVSHEPDFVKLIEDDPGGIISCTTHPRKALVSSFPTRPISAHLEFIWSPKQPQNRRYIFTGANPAYPVFVQLLVNDPAGVSASTDHSILA